MASRVQSLAAFSYNSGVVKIPNFSQFRTTKTLQEAFQKGISLPISLQIISYYSLKTLEI